METPLGNYNLLVVSDLHLSEGRDSSSKKFSKNEDFFFDEEFARFIAYYQDTTRWDETKWHLIINGDFADFLQVIATGDASSDRPRDLENHWRGLPCGEQETILKLKKIAAGHWLFFEALAGFVAAGNLLTIIKGNHDVEFHYAGVQSAFLAELESAFQRRLEREPSWGDGRENRNLVGEAVRFSEWFYFERDLLWIEHGNRYEGLNSFKYWLSPLLPDIPGWPPERKDEIDLPFGSLFVRYLFNRLERVEPFADNIKPTTKFVSWLIRKHPITALGFIFKDGRYLLDRIYRAWADLRPQAWERRKQQHNSRLRELAGESGIDFARLEELDRFRARSVLKEPDFRAKVWRTILYPWIFLPAVGLMVTVVLVSLLFVAINFLATMVTDSVRERILDPILGFLFPVASWAVPLVFLAGVVLSIRWLLAKEDKQQASYLKSRAARVAESDMLGVRYVVMGHTHDPELYSVGRSGGREKEYFNTGSWTTVFSEEERIIRKPVELVFVQGLRGGSGLAMKLLEWNDSAGEPRLLKLFRDE